MTDMPTPPVKRRRGRPRLDPADVSVDVHVRMTPKEYDEAWKRARADRVSLADFIRARLAAAANPPQR